MKFTEILAREVQKHLDNYYRIYPISEIKNKVYFKVQIWMDSKSKTGLRKRDNIRTLCYLELKEQQLLVYYIDIVMGDYGPDFTSVTPDLIWDLGNPEWSPEIVAEYIRKVGDMFVPKRTGVCLGDLLKDIGA
jgi:hypothetical protein